MFEYPLTNISKQLWHKKVQATLMFSIPAEDEALPILYEILDILQNLNTRSLQQVLGPDVQQYFFNEVIPQVCSKIIKSRYFKNQIVLTISNKILAQSLYLYPKFISHTPQFPGLHELITTILSSDQYYFKTNNQLDYKLYAHYYFDGITNLAFTETLKEGDMVDVIKSNGKYDKLVWSRGKILLCNESYLEVEYLNDVNEKTVTVDKTSFQVAEFMTKSKDFDWRMALKVEDLLDCQDSFGGWYHGTVLKVIDHGDNKKSVKVTFKVYDQNGNKSDQKGKFYGFTDQQQIFDVTVPKIMPFCSTCKYRNFQTAKSTFQTDDSNDMVFEQIGGEKIYAFPRKRALSQFYFKQLNVFGRMGGFDIPIEKLIKEVNFQFLCSYVKAIGNVAQYLHKQVIVGLVEKLKVIVEQHIFANSDVVTKEFTKERSQALFGGLKNIMKRMKSMEEVQQYENSLKMRLVSQCLESESLKRKLQGLHELKDIVRGISHISQRTKTIKAWILQEKIFDKIYLLNSHVQLIKKSEDFFKFLINEDILQVSDLERLYKIAQKGDYESRVSLYKLFQQMSHVFNKSHVDFLIDTILQSQLNLVLNEDIDMLHELSRFSNYFPKEKVKEFFERLILNDSKNKDLIEYAIKKYSEIVARGFEMKSLRREIIRNFVEKLDGPHYERCIKVLKGIFEGMNLASTGEWGRKDLCDILEEENIEDIIVKAIRENHERNDYKKLVNEMLNFQLFLVKLSPKVKIRLQTVRQIWEQLRGQQSRRKEYFRWLNQLMQCDQGIQSNQQQPQQSLTLFYQQLYPQHNITNLTKQQFQLSRNLFIQINKKSRNLLVSNLLKTKQIQKEYRRKCQMKSLKLIEQIEQIMFECGNREIAQKAFEFYMELYGSRENTKEEIEKLLETLLKKLSEVHTKGEWGKVETLLNLIQMVINDSERYQEFQVVSMIKCRKSSLINVTVINDVSYLSDCIKKQNLYQRRNISLLQLKHKISQKVNLPLQQLRLIGKQQYPDYYNSYTLSQLNLTSDQPLTVSRKCPNSIPEEQLIINQKLNPKAIRVFSIIFEKYATHDGQMSKDDYNRFTAMCLGTYSKNYHDKIVIIYNKYDSNHDGLLSFDDFIRFYEDSALDKPQTVWSNLKNLGVKGNFKFKDQPEQHLSQQDLPRYTLYHNNEFYNILFSLLQQNQLSKRAYNLLLRLPANKPMHDQIKQIWSQSYDSSQIENLRQFLKEQSKFRLMYKLILMLSMMQYTQLNNSMWNVRFAMKKGYEVPFELLKAICKDKDMFSGIDLDIIQLVFQIIKDYVYNSWGSKEAVESSNIFEEECTMDEKMEALVTGVYPKNYSTIRRDHSLAFKYEWHDPKSTFIQLFLGMLKKMKHQLLTPNPNPVLSSMTSKLMAMLCCLLVNQDQNGLLQLYPLFFDERQSTRSLNQFYIMILCVCFYSKPDQQHLHIHELFKYIKSKRITAEHFRVLALLVSKFGFRQENMTEIPEVLLKNILQEQNQPTIEGCAKLLCNFDVTQLKTITPKDVQQIFDRCLFGENITCRNQPARNQIYELLIKLSQHDKEIANMVVQKTKNVIVQNMPLMKVTYSSQVNKRCSHNYAGLKNLGNICYMNSMMQQLYTNKIFRYLILRTDDKKAPELTFDAKGEQVDDNLLHQVQRIFAYLEKTTRQQFSPGAFCVAYKPFGESVNIMMQQDVQEFVSMFFDRLEQTIKGHPLRNVIQNFYTGKTANLFKCHNCKKTKKIEENFHSISLEVKNSKNLSESFNRYALGQVINDYRCQFCQQKCDVSKMSRISHPPQVLIIHLQRIFFNLDTFINQKITTRHQFPMTLNIYPYTLQYFQKQESSSQHPTNLSAYDYELTGIIVHIGNAESGHYVSFIRVEEGKWLQFNDSIVSLFGAGSIEAECFGGAVQAFDDEFQWEKKESSKSAYILIYNRKVSPSIQLILQKQQLASKQDILQQLSLQEVLQQIKSLESIEKTSEPTESQEETGSAFEDSEKEREKVKFDEEEDIRQLQMIKKKKSQDNVPVNKPDHVLEKQTANQDKIIVKIDNTAITPYIPPQLQQQIQIDNRVHFFETSLASQGFSTFFAKLISIPHLHSAELIKMCQKLTFTFWLKSKTFKQLLQALQVYVKLNPQSVYELVLKNSQQFCALLIENSNVDVRVNVAHFLSSALQSYALSTNPQGKFLQQQSQQANHIFRFLNKLFDLIPTTVTKCWTKFNQYFEFWHLISQKPLFSQYLYQKQILKHFLDYFLDKKSPLKIYVTKKVQQIGSSYATPDFSMLLRCVSTIVNYYFVQQNNFQLTEDDNKVIVNFQFIQKLIAEGYQEIAAKLAKNLCLGNIAASEKFAVVLLKGFSKSTYENVQRYIAVMREFITIEDDHQQTRMQWVLGYQTLNISTITKSLSAVNSKTFEQRLYFFDSSLQVQQGSSFLQPIYLLNRRVQNFCILCVQGLLSICLQSKKVRSYVSCLPPPTLTYTRYIDFYQQFINRYIEQSKRSYYSTVTTFNKTELGQSVKVMYKKLMQMIKEEIKQVKEHQNVEQQGQENKEKVVLGNCVKGEKGEEIRQGQQKVDGEDQVGKFEKTEFLDGSFSNDNRVQNSEHRGQNNAEGPVDRSQEENVDGQWAGELIIGHTQEWEQVELISDEERLDKLHPTTSQQQPPSLVNKSSSQPQITQNPNDAHSSPQQQQLWQTDLIPQGQFNPIYQTFHQTSSNKNNSRKSQLQKDDSREQDFNAIEMKEINTMLEQNVNQQLLRGNSNDSSAGFGQQLYRGQSNDSNLSTGGYVDGLYTGVYNQQFIQYPTLERTNANTNAGQGFDDDDNWSSSSKEKGASAAAKDSAIKPRRNRKNKMGLKLPPKQQSGQLADSQSCRSQQQQQIQPFIKPTAVHHPLCPQLSPEPSQYPLIPTPIQFSYHPILSLPLQQSLFGVQATYHESTLTIINTRPTGTTNLAFSKVQVSRKLSSRIKDEYMKSKRQEIVKGYFVVNHSRSYVRVQMPTACYLVKPNESAWVWGDSILKIWKCERCNQWPDWSIFQ